MQSERNRNRRMSMFQKPEESKKNSSADKTEKIREIYRFLLSETDYLKEIGKEIDEERNYCKALTIFKICSFVSLLQECNSWRISCSMAEDESLYSSERI